MFGFAGAHRSGKTTTAKAVAEQMGVEFLETKVGSVFTDLGLDPRADLPFEQRLSVQDAILRSIEVQYQLRAGKVFIADRTPYDVMAYTLADVRRDSVTPELQDRMTAHMHRAQHIINQHLHGVIVLRPLPNQPQVEGKAQSCPYYMDHVYILLQHLVEAITPSMTGGIITGLSQSYDLDERIAESVEFFSMLREIYDQEPKIWTPNS